jgi:PAS domain S-box-containing protein
LTAASVAGDEPDLARGRARQHKIDRQGNTMGSPETTARQVAEAALREREAELARVQRIGRVGGFEIDLRDGQFASRRSPEYLEVHGLPPDAVDDSHDDWVRRLHPDDRERAETQFKTCVTDGASHYASEYRIIVPGQGTRWIAASGEIERDTTGAPLRMIGVHIDITRTKAAEAALRASEARLREVLDAIGEAFYTLDSAERFTNVSRRALEIWGVAADDLLGRRMSDVLPKVAQDAAYAAVRQSMVSGRHSRTEAPMATLGGRWAEQDAYPTGDGGVAVAFRDVHDRKRIELALKESEQRLRELNEQLERLANERARQLASSRAQLQAFFDNSPDWLTLQRCTPDGRFEYIEINPACEVAYGMQRDQVVGRTVEEILGHGPAQLPLARFRECLRTGQPQRYVTHRSLAGVTRTIDVIFALVPGGAEAGEGEVGAAEVGDRFILTSARDITEREQLETQLRQAQKMEAIGQLTGGVAHDFNNLLAVIIGNATMIKRKAPADPTRMLDNILSASERGVTLTRQLLSLSRHQPQSRSVVDLQVEVPRIAQMLRASLRGDIEMQVSIAPDVRPIEVDLGELEIALLNVAVNARDAMPTGGRFSVDVRNRGPHDAGPPSPAADRDYVAISLRDSGVGMPDEVVARASEPFFTTKKLGSGTGLGLSQVYGFAASSGGAVTIESKVGAGTCVTLLLPHTGKAMLASPDSDAGQRSQPLAGRVLLVDDNNEVASVTETMLGTMGLQVETAHHARAALERLAVAASRFDLLLTDVVMPGMNGVDLAREVRARLPDLPVILMSGYNDAVPATGNEFQLLRKPVPYEDLYDVIRSCLAVGADG